MTKKKQKKTTQNFPKNKHFLNFSTDTETYVCLPVGMKCPFFRKIWHALFSCYFRFEIRFFALLSTKYQKYLYTMFA